VLAGEGAVRAVVAASLTSDTPSATRPGHRFGLIDRALAPGADQRAAHDPEAPDRLRLRLATAMSAEALFTLKDVCGLADEEAVDAAAGAARALTERVTDPFTHDHRSATS
jgi:hypothetical protein